jgi:hypothetical protein
MPNSLMNMPTPPFHGAAHSLYGDRGPTQAHNTGRRKAFNGPPQSIEEHVQDALARVPDLSPKQRLALRNTLMTMTRDISFVRMIADQTRGPWSEAAVRGDEPR